MAHAGGLLLGMSLGNVDGLTGSLTGLLSLGLAECALFLAAAAFAGRVGAHGIASLAGIGRSMPWTLGAFAIAALGLAGAPPTAGFVSAWYLVLGALQSGLWPLALLFLAVDLAALIALGRVIELACTAPAARGSRSGGGSAAVAARPDVASRRSRRSASGSPPVRSAGVAARAAGALLEVAL